MEVWAVVVAAGSGSRFGGAKQFADLGGRPVVEWSLETARKVCHGVVVVTPADDQGLAPSGRPGRVPAGVDAVVAGAATRSGSVRAGLAAVPMSAGVIAVHDAARPLAPADLWTAVIDAVISGADGAVPAAPVTDTVKETDADGDLRTLDRSRLVTVQTPQAFAAPLLRAVHSGGADATDDAALVEAAGGRVVLVPAPRTNIKITEPSDLLVAAALLGAGL